MTNFGPWHQTAKPTNILQLYKQKNIMTKKNTGEVILESVPKVAQPYHESGTEVQFHNRSILKQPTTWAARLVQHHNPIIQNPSNMCNRNKNSNIKEIFKKQNHKAKILSCELYETSLNTNGIFSGNTFNKVTPRLGYNVQKYINPY